MRKSLKVFVVVILGNGLWVNFKGKFLIKFNRSCRGGKESLFFLKTINMERIDRFLGLKDRLLRRTRNSLS